MSHIQSDQPATPAYDASVPDESEWYRSLFTNSLDGILLTSPDGAILAANPAICRMLGYDEAEIRVLGRAGVLDVTDPGLPDALVKRRTTGRFAGKLTMIAKDGRRIPVDVSSRIYLNAAGQERTSTFVRDATERLRTEALLRQEEERARLLAEVTHTLAEMLDYERSLGKVAHLLVARTATLCLVDVVAEDGGVRRVEAVHADPARQPLADALREISLSDDRPHLAQRALQTGMPQLSPTVSGDDLRALAQHERHLEVLRELQVSSRLSLPLVARARTIGAITLVRDETMPPFDEHDLDLGLEIARRAALAIDNALLFRQARRATELRDQTLGIVSHDLRTPLTAISMALAPFERPQPANPELVQRLVAVTRQSVDWMTRMIRDLLDVASIDAGKLSVERGPDNLRGLIDRAHATFAPMFAAERIELRLDVPPRLPAADIDGERILQVIGNLLSNAAKFARAGGHVLLTARPTESEIVVTVRDDGPGIPADVVPHIFDRFWHARRSARTRGTGLGLSIAKAIVDAHGGRIWVETAEGEGSTFSFTVPVYRRDLAPS